MNTLEKISKFIGYKRIRHGLPYQFLCRKNRQKIDYLKSILSDEFSRKVMDTIMKSRQTRNYECLKEIYDDRFEFEFTGFGGVKVRRDPNHYFPKDIIQLSDNEVFLDVGGYTGDTALSFIEHANGNFKKIHIFEVSKRTSDELAVNLKNNAVDLNKILIHNTGLYSSNQETYFSGDAGYSKRAEGRKEESEKVMLVSLDSYLPEQDRAEITFVKMDIEGAEMAALQGMAQTISSIKPKLAISIYHLDTDLWEIPLYIHALNPDYKLYMRQHACVGETVCYAI